MLRIAWNGEKIDRKRNGLHTQKLKTFFLTILHGPQFFLLYISSSWLFTKNQLTGLPGSALKFFCGVGGVGGLTNYCVTPNSSYCWVELWQLDKHNVLYPLTRQLSNFHQAPVKRVGVDFFFTPPQSQESQFLLTPMGILATGGEQARPSARGTHAA